MNDTKAEKLRDEAVALVRQMREALFDNNLAVKALKTADAFLSRHEVEEG